MGLRREARSQADTWLHPTGLLRGLGIFGGGGGDRDRARAAEIWGEVREDAPGFEDLYNEVNPNAFFEPTTQEEAVDLRGRSEWGGVSSDGAGRDAQLQALRSLSGVVQGGGYTNVERGQIQQAQQQAAISEQRQRAGVVNQMAMQGLGGSGLEAASRMSAQQNAANQGRADATSIATAGQQRALQAMMAQGQQGAQARGQNFGEQASRADAIDRFNQANTNYRRDVNARNADRRANTNTRNTDRRMAALSRNADARTAARQQAFDNQVTAGAGETGQLNSNANANQQNRQQQQTLLAAGVNSYLGTRGGGGA